MPGCREQHGRRRERSPATTARASPEGTGLPAPGSPRHTLPSPGCRRAQSAVRGAGGGQNPAAGSTDLRGAAGLRAGGGARSSGRRTGREGVGKRMKLRGHLVEGAARSSGGEGGAEAAAGRGGDASMTVAPDARGPSGKTRLLQVGRVSLQSAT